MERIAGAWDEVPIQLGWLGEWDEENLSNWTMTVLILHAFGMALWASAQERRPST